MSGYITKEEVHRWLDGLRQSRDVVAPVKVDDLILFRRVDRVEEIAFDFANTDLSPKEFLLPATETLFRVEKRDGSVELVPRDIQRETVIFGIRPCDAKGMAALDLPYLEEPADGFYRQRREMTALVGLSCRTACAECFCTSMGTGPQDSSCVDVMLTEVDGGYLVELVTEKGRGLLPESMLSQKDAPAPAPPDVQQVPSAGMAEKLRQVFDDSYWGRLADRCLHCNVCSYVCPTCYCFDIRDYEESGVVNRVRSWESCQSPGFTKIAGGHDPRADKGSRLRQRFAHKLVYFPEHFGVMHCVGCGRCVRKCPVNIDIREVMRNVQQLSGGSDGG